MCFENVESEILCNEHTRLDLDQSIKVEGSFCILFSLKKQ